MFQSDSVSGFQKQVVAGFKQEIEVRVSPDASAFDMVSVRGSFSDNPDSDVRDEFGVDEVTD